MTTYVVKHPMLDVEVARFKDLPSTKGFLTNLSVDFRSQLVIENWVDFSMTKVRAVVEVFDF